MSTKTNNIENNVENITTREQKQGFYCKTENFFCFDSEIKKDISEIDEKLKPFYDFLDGTRIISLDLIKNVARLLGADDKLVENAKCIAFYEKGSCQSLDFIHQVGYFHILHGIKDIDELQKDDNYSKAVSDHLDLVYKYLAEFLPVFEKDIHNYEIHLIPKEGESVKVVKHFENFEFEVEEHIFKYVMKLYDLINDVETKFFDKKSDSVYKEQIFKALSKSCKFILSKITLNEHLGSVYPCSKIVHSEEKAQENLLAQDTKPKGEKTHEVAHLEDKYILGGNNLTSIGSESKKQTPVSTEIIVILVSCGISSVLVLIIYYVYGYFMKKRELNERRQGSDRIELLENVDLDRI